MFLLFQYWWQFVIIIIVLAGALVVVGKSTEKTLKFLQEFVITLSRELTMSTDSTRTAIFNLFAAGLAALLAIILVSPSLLVSLGLIQSSDHFNPILGVILFLAVFATSVYFIRDAKSSSRAFKKQGKKTSTNNEGKRKTTKEN